ncbi:hypothetical protein QBC44DRAFT_402385 [Cladorrhinum sp. PSN332]|nr:hypothetical protein QBC44DRAFT_402385 [Cladorrhinum sp. PSN332]
MGTILAGSGQLPVMPIPVQPSPAMPPTAQSEEESKSMFTLVIGLLRPGPSSSSGSAATAASPRPPGWLSSESSRSGIVRRYIPEQRPRPAIEESDAGLRRHGALSVLAGQPTSGTRVVRVWYTEDVLLRLDQGNLKCPASTQLPKLLELLWQHQSDVAGPKVYCDGREVPDRYHDFKKATARSSASSETTTEIWTLVPALLNVRD